MALKLNIRSDIEREMNTLLPKAAVRSKTQYINEAIREYNRKMKRQFQILKLKKYFKSYQKEGRVILDNFARLKNRPH